MHVKSIHFIFGVYSDYHYYCLHFKGCYFGIAVCTAAITAISRNHYLEFLGI